MFWDVQLYNALTHINNIVLVVIGLPFMLQLIYLILFWLPKKTFPKSEKKNKICVIIPAHNEEDVIFNTVKDLIDKQTYPMDLVDIYVIADNCTDNTAALAEKAGATVLVHNDPDESTHMVAYALKFGYEEILKTNIDYDFSIRLDADNHVNDEFLDLMNDAFNAGCQIARPYESALNMTQNNFTSACGLYYIFDSRFSSRVRERLHLSAHVNGPGSLTDFKIIKKIGGYDTTSITEDSEFNFKRMFEGYKCHYVEDAVVYEDLPSTFKDTFARNKRIAAGNISLLRRFSLKMIASTFTKLDFSFLENLFTYMFNIICVILCTWIPGYYLYASLHLGFNGYWETSVAHEVGLIGPGLKEMLIIIGSCLLFLFVFAGIMQGLLLVMLDYKKMGANKRRELIPGALLFPLFTVVYCLTMCIGAFCKPKWTKITRNTGDKNTHIKLKDDIKEENIEPIKEIEKEIS